jgi:hypothetical protein
MPTLRNDVGHQDLLHDLKCVLQDAKDCEFHDYMNKKYATPKVELVRQLNEIIKDVVGGVYDN